MNFFDHKDLGNHLLQLCPKVVKHPVFSHFFPVRMTIFFSKVNFSVMYLTPVFSSVKPCRLVDKGQDYEGTGSFHLQNSLRNQNIYSRTVYPRVLWVFSCSSQGLSILLPFRNKYTTDPFICC